MKPGLRRFDSVRRHVGQGRVNGTNVGNNQKEILDSLPYAWTVGGIGKLTGLSSRRLRVRAPYGLRGPRVQHERNLGLSRDLDQFPIPAVRLPRSATPPAFILRLPKGKSLALGAGMLRNLAVYKGPGFDQGGPPGPGSLPPPPGTVKWMRCNRFARLSSKQKESGSSPGIRTWRN